LIRSKTLQTMAVGLTIVASVAVFTASASAKGKAKPKPPKVTDITIGTSDPGGGASLLANLANANGWFTKYHLDVKVQAFGATLAAAVQSGEAQMYEASPASEFPTVAAGTDPVLLYGEAGGGYGGPIAAANPAITSVSQCTSVATGVVGTTGYAWAVQDKTLFNASYSITSFGLVAGIPAALETGQDNCAVIGYSAVAAAVAAGQLHYIVDPRDKSERPSDWPLVTEGSFYSTASALKSLGKTAVTEFIEAIQQTVVHDLRGQTLSKLATEEKTQPFYAAASFNAVDETLNAWLPFAAPDGGVINSALWAADDAFYANGGLSSTASMSATPTGVWSYASRVNMSYLEAADKALGLNPTTLKPSKSKPSKGH
jgi:hypothetical protein